LRGSCRRRAAKGAPRNLASGPCAAPSSTSPRLGWRAQPGPHPCSHFAPFTHAFHALHGFRAFRAFRAFLAEACSNLRWRPPSSLAAQRESVRQRQQNDRDPLVRQQLAVERVQRLARLVVSLRDAQRGRGPSGRREVVRGLCGAVWRRCGGCVAAVARAPRCRGGTLASRTGAPSLPWAAARGPRRACCPAAAGRQAGRAAAGAASQPNVTRGAQPTQQCRIPAPPCAPPPAATARSRSRSLACRRLRRDRSHTADGDGAVG
jgi:hypothetical protein